MRHESHGNLEVDVCGAGASACGLFARPCSEDGRGAGVGHAERAVSRLRSEFLSGFGVVFNRQRRRLGIFSTNGISFGHCRKKEGQDGAIMTELSVPLSKLHQTIRASTDLFVVRQKGRALAKKLDFSAAEATLFAAIVSELGRDILVHAHSGEMSLEPVKRARRVGIRLTAACEGYVSPSTADWFLRSQTRVGHFLEEVGFHSLRGSEVALTGIRWRPGSR